MNIQEQIIELAPLMSQAQVALKLGVSEGYVSQVLGEEEYSRRVIEEKLKLLDESTERDQKWNKLEDTLLEKMEEQISSLYKPQDVLRALLAVNRATRRGATAQDLSQIRNSQTDKAIVHLHLPAAIKPRFTLSSSQEVVEVNGRPLITQDSRTLYKEALLARKEKENEPAQRLSRPERISKTDIDLDA